jgi:hypothetical protein
VLIYVEQNFTFSQFWRLRNPRTLGWRIQVSGGLYLLEGSQALSVGQKAVRQASKAPFIKPYGN